MPGVGGLVPLTGVHCPLAGNDTGNVGAHVELGLSSVAPPPVRSASVTVPASTFATRAALEGGICHTLASYVSTHVVPTKTESGGHVVNGPTPGGPCIPGSPFGPTAPNGMRSSGFSFFLHAWRSTMTPDFFTHSMAADAGPAASTRTAMRSFAHIGWPSLQRDRTVSRLPAGSPGTRPVVSDARANRLLRLPGPVGCEDRVVVCRNLNV